eukprot:GEMP01002408.1.p1 GENE.GEMP01002408.1~~GEMP01002408.1.p1  ORF type:complete len:1112 (+),score=250.82 GEMP01002408.1:98-3433(+)
MENPCHYPPVEIIEIPKPTHAARLKSAQKFAPSVNFWAGRGWRGVEYEWNAFGYSPDALKMFERMMRVCKDDLERLFIFKTQHIFDADATRPPKDVCGLDAMVAGCSMTSYFSGLLVKVVADFTKFAQALLRSDITTGPTLEPAKIMAELEKCSASNKTLDDQYSRLLSKFNQARRAWVREQYEWKERFMRCGCAARDWSPNVTFYEDAMWGDEGEIHKFYQGKLKSMEDLFEMQISKLDAQILDMQSEIREKNERVEELKKLAQDLHSKETAEEPVDADTEEVEVQTTVEMDYQFCQVPQDLYEITHENPCMFHEACTACGFGTSKNTEQKKVRRTIVTKESATAGSRVRKGPGGMLLHVETGDTESSEWSCGSLISADKENGQFKVYFDDPEALARSVNVKDLDSDVVASIVGRLSKMAMPDGFVLDSDSLPQSAGGLLDMLPSLPLGTVAAAGFDCIGGVWHFDQHRIELVAKKDYMNFLPDLTRLLGSDHALVNAPVDKIRELLKREDQSALLEQGIICLDGFDEDVLFGIDTRHLSAACQTFFTGEDGQVLSQNMQQKTREHGVQTIEYVDTDDNARGAVHEETAAKDVHLERVVCTALHIAPAEVVVEKEVVSPDTSYDLDVLADRLARLRTELSSKIMPWITKPFHDPQPTVNDTTRTEPKIESVIAGLEGGAGDATEAPAHAVTAPSRGSGSHSPSRDALLSPVAQQAEMSVQTDLDYEVGGYRSPPRSPGSARTGTTRGKSPRPGVGGGFYQQTREKEKPASAGGSVIHALSRWRLGALPTLLANGYHMLEPLKLPELASALCDADLPCSEVDLQMLFAVGQGGKCRPSSTVTLKLLFGRLHHILFGSHDVNHRHAEPRHTESARSGGESFERLSTVEIAFRHRREVQSEFELSNEPAETTFRSTFGGGFRARDSSSDTAASSRPLSGLQNTRRPRHAHAAYPTDPEAWFPAELDAASRPTSPPPPRSETAPATTAHNRRPGSQPRGGWSVAPIPALGERAATTPAVCTMELFATAGLPLTGSRMRGIMSTGDLRSDDRQGGKKRESGGHRALDRPCRPTGRHRAHFRKLRPCRPPGRHRGLFRKLQVWAAMLRRKRHRWLK